MKLKDFNRLLSAIEEVHQVEEWSEMGTVIPRVLDSMIGADFSCWNVFNRKGELLEVYGTKGYEATIGAVMDSLNENLAQHPVISNTKIGKGEVVDGTFRMSDFLGQNKFENTGLYQDAYRHLDARYQVGTQAFIEGGLEVTFAVSRRLKDYDDDSVELLEVAKKHFAIACRRLLREKELKERVALLMDHAAPGTSKSMMLDQHGKVLETKGDVEALLTCHFECVRGALPATLMKFLSKQEIGLAASRRTVIVKDDFGGELKLTLLHTGFATRLTVLFHEDGADGLVASGTRINTLHKLSRRERDVLYWIAEGKSNPEIAILLAIALRTVDKHCENIYQKLGVENRMAAAREWLVGEV